MLSIHDGPSWSSLLKCWVFELLGCGRVISCSALVVQVRVIGKIIKMLNIYFAFLCERYLTVEHWRCMVAVNFFKWCRCFRCSYREYFLKHFSWNSNFFHTLPHMCINPLKINIKHSEWFASLKILKTQSPKDR